MFLKVFIWYGLLQALERPERRTFLKFRDRLCCIFETLKKKKFKAVWWHMSQV